MSPWNPELTVIYTPELEASGYPDNRLIAVDLAQVRLEQLDGPDAERCLEVIVMRGRADKLQIAAEKLFATRGVIQGSIEIVAAEVQAEFS